MWKPIEHAPRDGATIWVGNSKTGEMRLARWGKFPLLRYIEPTWLDVILSECITLTEVRIMPDVYADIPKRPNIPPDELLIDHLAEVFWQHHRQAMLKACDNVVDALEGKEEQNEKLREAVRIGIRAVIDELNQH